MGKLVLKYRYRPAGNQVERADDDSVEEQDILLGAIESTKEDTQTREEVIPQPVHSASMGCVFWLHIFLLAL